LRTTALFSQASNRLTDPLFRLENEVEMLFRLSLSFLTKNEASDATPPPKKPVFFHGRRPSRSTFVPPNLPFFPEDAPCVTWRRTVTSRSFLVLPIFWMFLPPNFFPLSPMIALRRICCPTLRLPLRGRIRGSSL